MPDTTDVKRLNQNREEIYERLRALEKQLVPETELLADPELLGAGAPDLKELDRRARAVYARARTRREELDRALAPGPYGATAATADRRRSLETGQRRLLVHLQAARRNAVNEIQLQAAGSPLGPRALLMNTVRTQGLGALGIARLAAERQREYHMIVAREVVSIIQRFQAASEAARDATGRAIDAVLPGCRPLPLQVLSPEPIPLDTRFDAFDRFRLAFYYGTAASALTGLWAWVFFWFAPLFTSAAFLVGMCIGWKAWRRDKEIAVRREMRAAAGEIERRLRTWATAHVERLYDGLAGDLEDAFDCCRHKLDLAAADERTRRQSQRNEALALERQSADLISAVGQLAWADARGSKRPSGSISHSKSTHSEVPHA